MKTTARGRSCGLYLSLSPSPVRFLDREAHLLRRSGRMEGRHVVSLLASVAGGLPREEDPGGLLTGTLSLFSIHPAAERSLELPPGGARPDVIPFLRRHSFQRIVLITPAAEEEGETFPEPPARDDLVRRARAAGIARVGVDVRGFERVPEERLVALLRSAAALGAETISLYESDRLEAGESSWIERYRAASALLSRMGYVRREISHFALPGAASVHQRLVYGGGDVVGLGPGAVSHVGARRWRNQSDPARYEEELERHRLPVAEEMFLSREELFRERIFLGLRRSVGVDPHSVARSLGLALSPEWESRALRLCRRGWLESRERRLMLTDRGIPLAEALADEVGRLP